MTIIYKNAIAKCYHLFNRKEQCNNMNITPIEPPIDLIDKLDNNRSDIVLDTLNDLTKKVNKKSKKK